MSLTRIRLCGGKLPLYERGINRSLRGGNKYARSIGMKNELQVFMFENRRVRITDRNGDPWFVAKDVCNILGIGNPTETLRNFPENERMTVSITEGHSGQRGGAQFLNLINEPGMYRLIFQSRKQEAEAFKTWVFHEVLPSIRKTGSYTLGERITSLGDLDAARIVWDRVNDTRRIFDNAQQEKTQIFFDVWIEFTGNRENYLQIKEVYEKYADEFEHTEILSRTNFTYRVRKMFPHIGYGPKKVNGYPCQAFFGVRFQD